MTWFRRVAAWVAAEQVCTGPCCDLSDMEVDPLMLTDEQCDRIWAMLVGEVR